MRLIRDGARRATIECMRRSAITVLVALGACGPDGSPEDDVPVSDAADAPVCPPARLIFLARGGGTYMQAADDDSSANRSRIVTNTMTFPPPTIVDGDWPAFVTCVRSKFERFNVIVTEQDPGAAAHVELVVIDQPSQLMLANGASGIAPFECDPGGGPRDFERGVPFLMWNAIRTTADRCWTASQVLGNTYGLDHALACPDLMTVQGGCPGLGDAKTFTDADVPCGEASARACTCGGATQNSFRYLTDVLGAGCR